MIPYRLCMLKQQEECTAQTLKETARTGGSRDSSFWSHLFAYLHLRAL